MQRSGYLAGLDLVRFGAASFVMLYHLGLASWAAEDGAVRGLTSYPELMPLAWMGWIGVEVFFVISGFVITYSSAGRTAGEFVRHRIMRLYPAAWVCATLTFAVAVLLHLDRYSVLGRQWAASVTLWPFAAHIDTPYWTLAIEIAFYALIASMLALRRGRNVGQLCAVLIAGSLAYGLTAVVLAPEFGLRHMWNIWLELSLLQYGCFFALGALIWLGQDAGWTAWRIAGIVAALIAAVSEVVLKAIYNLRLFDHDAAVAWPVLVFLLGAAAIFWSARHPLRLGDRQAWLVRRLGLATYPLYLTHNLIGSQVLRQALPVGGRWPALLLAVLICLAVAFATLSAERALARRLKPLLFRQRPVAGLSDAA